MIKKGKFDKPRTQRQKIGNSGLLQTYIVSVLCLVLCCTMFLSTTFAWFTSNVTSSGNEIHIGILNAELWHGDVKINDNPDHKIFDSTLVWQPGMSTEEELTIKNEGDLAFRFMLQFLVSDTAVVNNGGEPTLTEEIARCFEVFYMDTAVSQEWIAVKGFEGETVTLAEILAQGIPVLQGEMAPDAEATYEVKLHFKDDSQITNIMGQTLRIDVRLVATQYYTGYQMVDTASDLAEALQTGQNVILTRDIVPTETLTVPADKKVILDLNGCTISGMASETMTSMIVNKGTLTIQNSAQAGGIFFDSGNNSFSAAVNAIENRGDLTVNSGVIHCTARLGQQISYAIDNNATGSDAKLTVNGGTIMDDGASQWNDGIRLFCSASWNNEVIINGGDITTVWLQNPTNGKLGAVNGKATVNGGTIHTVFFEPSTTVAASVSVTVTKYGADSYNQVETVENGVTYYTLEKISD